MKKLLLIQLDGVSYPVVEKAMKRGYLSSFKQLIRDKSYIYKEIYSNLPSLTSARQLSVLYGDTDTFPAFSLYDRKHKRHISPAHPTKIHLVEKEVQKKHPEALANLTTAIALIFAGTSKESLSTSSIRPGGISKNRHLIQQMLRYTENPFRILDFLARAFVHSMIIKTEQKGVPRKGRELLKKKIWSNRLMEDAMFAEVANYYTKKALLGSRPIVYVNFAGYDAAAHWYGPDHKYSFLALSLINSHLKNLISYVSELEDSWEIVIFSDHGQSETVPIDELIGCSLGGVIAQKYPDSNIAEIRGMPYDDHVQPKMEHDSDILLICSGGLACLYVIGHSSVIGFKKIEAFYPGLCKAIAETDGVSFLIVVKEKRHVIIDAKGSHALSAVYFKKTFGHSNSEAQRMTKELDKMLHGPHAPDIYIFSNPHNKKGSVTFEYFYGSHGSFDGDQTRAFILAKNDFAPFSSISCNDEMHDAFYSYVKN